MMAVSATDEKARRIMSQWISSPVRVHVAACEGPLGHDLVPRLRGRDLGRREPAPGRVVVVRAGVDHAVRHEPVRQVLFRARIGRKPKLKHPHPGQAEFIAERLAHRA